MGKAAEIARGWLRHRTVLIDLLERIGNEHLHYKPWNNAFAAAETRTALLAVSPGKCRLSSERRFVLSLFIAKPLYIII